MKQKMEHSKEIKLEDLFKSEESTQKPLKEIYDPEHSEVRIYNNRKYLVRKKKKA